MKRIIKTILLHLPVISVLYRKYCFFQKSINEQKKAIKKLSDVNEKQSREIKKLLEGLKEKDKEIQNISALMQERMESQLEGYRTVSHIHFENIERDIKKLRELSDYRSGKSAEDIKRLDYGLQKLSDTVKDNKEDMNRNLLKERMERQNGIKTAENSLNTSVRRRYFQGLHEDNYKKALTEWLYESIGEVADLDNPKSFNEKIQWLKLHADKEPYRTLADKYKVRKWIADKIGEEYLIPLLGVWENFDDIDFDSLPDKFVLKANHGCKYNYIVTDKSRFNRTDARNKFNRWMKENFAWNSLELQYRNIPRRIIAEEYIENSDNNLNDYKIFCFDGKPMYIAFYTERQESLRIAIFDLEWNLMPFTTGVPRYTQEVEKPKNLEEMIRLAGILAEGFPHVRVDFYVLNDGSIKFGEMTFSTASGFVNWQPKEYNRILGDMITLPEEI